MAVKPNWAIMSDCRDKLGESPQWSHGTGELFWVDFYGPIIRRLSRDGSRRDWTLPRIATIGSIVQCDGDRLICGTNDGLYIFSPEDGSISPFADPNDGRAELSYNDAKVDRHGNYWTGNFDNAEAAPRGILYVRTRPGNWRVGDSGFVVCNGPAFSPDGKVLYFNDSAERQSLAYDLDPATGNLTKRRVFQKYTQSEGLPDGCCVDSAGCVWVAMYDGGQVIRLSPEGERLETLALPVRNITSCCLGGKDLRTLYVTTGRAADASEPDGGALFATIVDVPGLPEPMVRL